MKTQEGNSYAEFCYLPREAFSVYNYAGLEVFTSLEEKRKHLPGSRYISQQENAITHSPTRKKKAGLQASPEIPPQIPT